MPKKTLASLELTAIVNELQYFVRGKITQLYNQDNQEFIFQLHVQNKGKQLLKIIPGKLLCLTQNKNPPLKPSGFCMQLRKYLDNATINKLYQKDAERVVVFELEKKEKFFLIIELFSKGNIILTDQEYTIIGALEQQLWKDRKVEVHSKYQFPASEHNWKDLSSQKLFTIIKHSNKKNLATTLATELGLGGLYAEELCLLAGVDKNKASTEITKKEAASLTKTLQKIQQQLLQPQGFIYAEQITPFALQNIPALATKTTYNEAIDTLNPFQKASPYQKKIAALQTMVEKQQESIQKQQKSIELNTKKGELIYQQYTPLQKLREIVTELKKNHDWQAIAAELKKEKKIKSIDLKEKKILIDL